jgi:hypothetical protein
MPTSFITCSSCHRGRVLKIISIEESSTEEILNEIYSSIGKHPCSKRKQTSKETQDAFNKSFPEGLKKAKYLSESNTSIVSSTSSAPASNVTTQDQNYSPLQPNTYFSSVPSLNHSNVNSENSSNHQSSQIQLNPLLIHQGGPVNLLSSKPQLVSAPNINSLNNAGPSGYNHSGSVNPVSLPQSGTPQPGLISRIPTIEEFLGDFEDLQELPNINEKLDIKSIGSNAKISAYTLSALFNGMSSFPISLDLFLSLSVETDITDKFFTLDTLIIPLPAYSATMFMKDFNKNHFLTDENLTSTISKRILDFISQPSVNLQNLKIVIIFNYFQEGVPDRPHENQSHKYVGNIYVINRLNVLQDSSLTFTNSRYTFNHNYTWVDPKEEWVKVEMFNELIIKPLQSEIFMKYHQDLLGNHLHGSVLERGSTINLIPYTVDESFLVTASSSLYVVNFITLKIIRILCAADGLQMISYLLSVKVNSRHNLHLLKILLDRLKGLTEQPRNSN